MKLYEITGAFLELMEMAQDESLDQETISNTLEDVEDAFEDKADGYAKIIKSLEGDVEAIDKEIARLNDRKGVIKNNIAGIKKNLETAMQAIGKPKFKTLLFSYGIQKNPASVVIDDGAKVPEKFLIAQDPKVDKAAVRDYLKGNEADWAHLEQTESLRIR